MKRVEELRKELEEAEAREMKRKCREFYECSCRIIDELAGDKLL